MAMPGKRGICVGLLGAGVFVSTLAPTPPALAQATSKVQLAGAYTQVEIREMTRRLAKEDGRVPASLVLAVAKTESNFNPDAVSAKGARGVMQIMPATAQYELNADPDDLWNPETNILLGIEYLARLYVQYGKRWDAALSHYNGGSLNGEPLTAAPHGYTADYVKTVLALESMYADQYPYDPQPIALAQIRSPQEGTVPFYPEQGEQAMPQFTGCDEAPEIGIAARSDDTLPTLSNYEAITGAGSVLSPAEALLAKIDRSRLRFRNALQASNL